MVQASWARGRARAALAAAVMVTLTILHMSFWSNRLAPIDILASPGRLQSVSYSPSGRTSDAQKVQTLDPVSVEKDLVAIASIADGIRTYTLSNGQDIIPELASEEGLSINLGIWAGKDALRTRTELDEAVRLAHSVRGIQRIIVGNEALLRGELTDSELAGLIREVRRRVPRHIQVGTSDTWHAMLKAPETIAASDFIGIHTLPFWEDHPADDAVAYALDKVREVQAQFPNKPVWVGEIGWPSAGSNRHAAYPSPQDQARIVRAFADYARHHNLHYNVIEAFDQPWKVALEGGVGAAWGVMDADRKPKFQLSGPYAPAPIVRYSGLAAVSFGTLASIALAWRRWRRATPGQIAISSLALHGAAAAAGLTVTAMASEYATWGAIAMWGSGLGLGMILAVLAFVDLDEAGMTLLARAPRRLLRRGVSLDASVRRPKVSIHIAARNEDPTMLSATLDSLAALNYDNWEAVVAINNTADKSLVAPVEAYCQLLNERLGIQRFKFADFTCTGFKAGALNRALTMTAPDAEIIAVLDADYTVQPDWLDRLAPVFVTDPQCGIVQAPQEHRDGADNWLKRLMAAEYRAFFDSGMIERNEDDALICHGTMIMVRRTALEQVGGWSEWCIVEDTELGLKLLEQGWTIHYTKERLGAGITPDSFRDFRQQRDRWAYGSVQIMKAHWRHLLPNVPGLTVAQKLRFASGWARWWADALGLIGSALAIAWTTAACVTHLHLPPVQLTSLALSALIVRALASMALTRWASGHNWIDTLGTSLIGMSLSTTVGRAILKGLMTKHEPFKVTAKGKRKTASRFCAWPEALLAAALLAAALAATLINRNGALELDLWTALVGLMALPNVAATLLAISDLMPQRTAAATPLPAALRA
ncbi:MAG: glycosyltransferase [Azospirillaceae bacterium]|nr:glycosyltransferase [Azospirillaceae bacterium]